LLSFPAFLSFSFIFFILNFMFRRLIFLVLVLYPLAVTALLSFNTFSHHNRSVHPLTRHVSPS
jgi:predicted RND superfamily exporter protein